MRIPYFIQAIFLLAASLAVLSWCQSANSDIKRDAQPYLGNINYDQAQSAQPQIVQPTKPAQQEGESAQAQEAQFSDKAQLEPTAQAAISDSDIIKIPLSELSAQAKFFQEDIGGTTVKYFVVMTADGSVKTAFDACDVCYKSKKGYHQEGDEMVCNNCGRHFKIGSLGVANFGSGCWPSYLKSRIDGDYLIISKADISEKKYMFV